MKESEAKDMLFAFMPKGMTMQNVLFETAIEEIYADFKVELEDAKAQGFREAIKEMGKVKGV